MGYTLGYHGCHSVVTPAFLAVGAALGNHHCPKIGHNAVLYQNGHSVQEDGSLRTDCGAKGAARLGCALAWAIKAFCGYGSTASTR